MFGVLGEILAELPSSLQVISTQSEAITAVFMHLKCILILFGLANKYAGLVSFFWQMWACYKCDLTRKRSLRLAVLKRIAVQSPFITFERLELSVQKILSSIRTAWAIRSKNIAIHSNGLSYPFKKMILPSVWMAQAIRSKHIVICSKGWSYPFKKYCHPFEWLSTRS